MPSAGRPGGGPKQGEMMSGREAEAHEIDLTTGDGHVALVDGSVHVHGWRTRNAEIVRYFEDRLAEEEQPDLGASLELALKVGVAALGSVGPAVNVDYVEKEFQRLSTEMQRALDERVRHVEDMLAEVFAEEDGRLARALRTYIGEDGHLAELFDPDRRDSAISRLREILGEHFDGETSKLHRLLDLDNPSGPLVTWKDTIDGGFDRIRRQIEEYRTELTAQAAADTARAEEREKGTQKGRDHEEAVYEALCEIASVFGDSAEPTGDEAATGGSRKVGDVVVTLNERDTRGAEVRLVVEAKDRSVGLKPILRELEEAKANRLAGAAIAVFARDEQMPSGTAPFREQTGGRFLSLYDKEALDPLCLQVVYRLARYLVLAEVASEEGEVDVRGIRDDLEIARGQLEHVSTVKRQLTRMRNSVNGAAEEIEGQLETLRSGLVETLDRLDGRIRIEAAPDVQVPAGS